VVSNLRTNFTTQDQNRGKQVAYFIRGYNHSRNCSALPVDIICKVVFVLRVYKPLISEALFLYPITSRIENQLSLQFTPPRILPSQLPDLSHPEQSLSHSNRTPGQCSHSQCELTVLVLALPNLHCCAFGHLQKN